MKALEYSRLRPSINPEKSRDYIFEIPGILKKSRDRDFKKILGSRHIPGSRRGLIITCTELTGVRNIRQQHVYYECHLSCSEPFRTGRPGSKFPVSFTSGPLLLKSSFVTNIIRPVPLADPCLSRSSRRVTVLFFSHRVVNDAVDRPFLYTWSFQFPRVIAGRGGSRS